MPEKYYKVLRCSSLSELNLMLNQYSIAGWKPVGDTEKFNGEFVQPIKINFNLDNTEEITQEITQHNIEK